MVYVSRIIFAATEYTSKSLYKHLLRQCEKLPSDASEHYKHSIKQSFKQHYQETDKERIQQIIQRAVEDAEWVLKKYTEKKKV